MNPDPDLVSGLNGVYALSNDIEFLIYNLNSKEFVVNMNKYSGKYKITWFNPNRKSSQTPVTQVTGGAKVNVYPPHSGSWLALFEKIQIERI